MYLHRAMKIQCNVWLLPKAGYTTILSSWFSLVVPEKKPKKQTPYASDRQTDNAWLRYGTETCFWPAFCKQLETTVAGAQQWAGQVLRWGNVGVLQFPWSVTSCLIKNWNPFLGLSIFLHHFCLVGCLCPTRHAQLSCIIAWKDFKHVLVLFVLVQRLICRDSFPHHSHITHQSTLSPRVCARQQKEVQGAWTGSD